MQLGAVSVYKESKMNKKSSPTREPEAPKSASARKGAKNSPTLTTHCVGYRCDMK